MKFEYKSSFALIVVVSLMGLIGCSSDSDDDPPKRATIVPGINPAFDTIEEVATSVAADGPYTKVAIADYGYADETIIFKEDFIVRAIFVRVKGKATLDGTQDSYTVYTRVTDNTTAIAANELTSIAVLAVGIGSSTSFSAAINDVVSKETGLSSSTITTATKTTARSKELVQSMRTLARHFKDGASVPGTTSVSSITLLKPELLEQVALGAQAYGDWLKVCADDSCDTSQKPDETKVTKAGGDTGNFDDFVQCKSCHGWDMLGNEGGFAFRQRIVDKDDYRDRPNSRSGTNISDVTAKSSDISRPGSDARYANNKSPTTNILTADDWNTIVDEKDSNDKFISNSHPNFAAKANNGINSVVPSAEIIDALVAFLNFEDAAASEVFSSIDFANEPVDYTLVTTAVADRGAKYYAAWCFRCHSAPNNSSDKNPLLKVGVANFVAYLENPSRLSNLRHIAQWGKAGTSMIRARLGYPNVSNVADIIAFLREAKAGTRTSGDGFAGVGDVTAGQAKFDKSCSGCHKADKYDEEAKCFSRSTGARLEGSACSGSDAATAPDLVQKNFAMQRDLGEVSSIMKNVPNLSQQEINDMVAFFTSNIVNSAPSQ